MTVEQGAQQAGSYTGTVSVLVLTLHLDAKMPTSLTSELKNGGLYDFPPCGFQEEPVGWMYRCGMVWWIVVCGTCVVCMCAECVCLVGGYMSVCFPLRWRHRIHTSTLTAP